MRKPVVVLLSCCMAGAAPYAASASPRFKATFDLGYVSRAPGVSTGLTTVMTWSDPGAPGGVPKVIKKIRLRFQPGTRFDTSALPRCAASDEAIKSRGAAACPAKSRVGSGSTVGVFASGLQFTTKVTLLNANRQIIVLVTLNGAPVTEFRDQVQRDTITVKPVLPAGVALKRLALRIDPHSTGRGAAQKAYMRTPPTCAASGHWTTAGTFSYADGSGRTFLSRTACRARGRGASG
jgi:hypothetical protein